MGRKKVVHLQSRLKRGWLGPRVLKEERSKKLKKVLQIKKKFLPLQPRLRKGLEKRAGRLQVQKEIIEKTEGKYKEASTKNK